MSLLQKVIMERTSLYHRYKSYNNDYYTIEELKWVAPNGATTHSLPLQERMTRHFNSLMERYKSTNHFQKYQRTEVASISNI
jgi:hypothetical protein